MALDSAKQRAAAWRAMGAKTYFWDERLRRWTPLKTVKGPSTETFVRSEAIHFTLMLNAVVKEPDHAGPQSFAANRVSSIEAASPTAAIDFIEPPEVTSLGD